MADKKPRFDWPHTMFSLLRAAGVELFCYVPDAGNDRLISLATNDNKTRTVLLTTEEEGLAIWTRAIMFSCFHVFHCLTLTRFFKVYLSFLQIVSRFVNKKT